MEIIRRGIVVNPEQSLYGQFKKEHPNLEYGVRTGLRTAARGISTLAGAPGDILNLGFGAANYVAPEYIPKYSDIQKKGGLFPQTSQQVFKGLSDVTGGYLEPQNEGEQDYDNWVSEITALSRGGTSPKSLVGLAKKVGKAAGIVGAGNLAATGAEKAGFGGLVQGVAKFGTQFLLGLHNTYGELAERAGEAFNEGEKLVEGQLHNVGKVGNAIKDVTHKIEQSDITDKANLLERAAAINNVIGKPTGIVSAAGKEISSPTAPVGSVMQLIRDLNARIRNSTQGEQREWLNKLAQPLREFVNDFADSGSEIANKFKPVWRESRDIFKGMNDLWDITKNINKYINSDKLNTPIGKMMTHALAYNWQHIPKAAGAAALAYGAKAGVNLANFLSKSSVARDAYGNLLKDLATGYAPGINRYFNILNKEADKYGLESPDFVKSSREEFDRSRSSSPERQRTIKESPDFHKSSREEYEKYKSSRT